MRSILIPILLAPLLTAAEKPQTPKQPWSEYRVHDVSRPHPEKVTGGACVTTPAPSDAVVLFDGSGTDALTVDWPIQDGSLVANGKDTRSKEEFASCQVHLEWRIPAGRKVKDQVGGNSGVFLMDRYEVQVQESHTNVTYADGQAAALYGQTPPLLNASLPQGEWQSYDIIFTAPVYGDKGMEEPARVTVIHNGVVVQDNTEIYGGTVFRRIAKYSAKHPEKAPLRLQWHKDPIEYRNIWVRPLD
ncbi:3-keto-disaccharide hydrolase [Rubritalea sp.]|uniref:3-keto-disaccharide hydrolase n=1 Tax=Rubritalea sp. TaxID=2109375 RepID=UPI003EF326B8